MHWSDPLKGIILAHNYHVKNTGITAGKWLKRTLKDDYLSIGVLIGNGTQIARNLDDSKLVVCPVPPILPDSYESVFDQVSEQPFVLDMKMIRSNSSLREQLVPRVLTEATAANVISKFSHYIIDVTEEYDYIVYFPKVEAMIMIE